VLASRAATEFPLGHPGAVARLLKDLRETGNPEQVTALLRRNPAAHALPDDLYGAARLLQSLRDAGANEQVTTLAARTATYGPVDDPNGVARLLVALHKKDEQEQVTVLADRAADRVPHNHSAVARLLHSLRDAGAHKQVAALADRLPGAGKYELFLFWQDHRDRFRFGRETDGSPAVQWSWQDLDLRLFPIGLYALGADTAISTENEEMT
jgi:hypothetical protein